MPDAVFDADRGRTKLALETLDVIVSMLKNVKSRVDPTLFQRLLQKLQSKVSNL